MDDKEYAEYQMNKLSRYDIQKKILQRNEKFNKRNYAWHGPNSFLSKKEDKNTKNEWDGIDENDPI